MIIITIFSLNIVKGIGAILLGLISIWYIYKFPVDSYDVNKFTIGIYLNGILCIIIGIAFLLK